MPLKVTHFGAPSDPTAIGNVAALNKWADFVEQRLHSQTKQIFQVSNQTVVGGGGGGVKSVGLAMPLEFTVTGSPVTSSGVLTAAWAPETPGTVLQVPPPGLAALQLVGVSKGAGTLGTLSVTGSARTLPATAFISLCSSVAPSTPSGWTALSTAGVCTKTQTLSTLFSASEAFSTDWAAAIWILGGSPTIVQSKASSGASGTLAYTSNNTGGNMLMAILTQSNFDTNPGIAPSVSDSNGNLYTNIVSQAAGGFAASDHTLQYNYVFLAPGCVNGANTVTFNFGDPQNHSGIVTIVEIGPPSGTQSFPSFSNLFVGELPPVNLNSRGNGGVGGILPTTNGGTGVSASSTGAVTGGVGVVLAGSPTITTPTISGAIPTYDGFTTAGIGLSPIIGIVDRTAQSAAITTTTIVTPLTATQCRLSWDAKVTTAATTSSTLGALTITYTDPDGVVQTITAAADSAAGVHETTDTGNTTTTVLLGHTVPLNVKAVTNVQFAFGYVSSGATAMQYNLHIRVEAMG